MVTGPIATGLATGAVTGGATGIGLTGTGAVAGDAKLLEEVFAGGFAGASGAAVSTSVQPLRVPIVVKTAFGGSVVVSLPAPTAFASEPPPWSGCWATKVLGGGIGACHWEPALTSNP